MADLTRPIKPRSHDRSHAGISHERLARRRYAPCPRFWRLLFDPWRFRGTRRLANPEVSDGDATLGWPWDSADRVFGPYGVFFVTRLKDKAVYEVTESIIGPLPRNIVSDETIRLTGPQAIKDCPLHIPKQNDQRSEVIAIRIPKGWRS